MAAIASTQVTVAKGSGRYVGGQTPHTAIEQRLVITGVTAADTASAAVCGLARLISVHSAMYEGTPNVPLLVGVDEINNVLIVGAGPANVTIHVTVVGSPSVGRE